MHFAPRGEDGRGCVWVAKRVPDDHVSFAADSFVVTKVDLEDEQNYLGLRDMREVAQAKGWWNPSRDGEFNFAAAFSAGEYDHKYCKFRAEREITPIARGMKLTGLCSARTRQPVAALLPPSLPPRHVRWTDSGRRLWRLFSLAAPSLNVPSEYEDGAICSFQHQSPYPESARPDEKLELADVFRMHRDVFQGTKYDLMRKFLGKAIER